jgi:hypothetical protein
MNTLVLKKASFWVAVLLSLAGLAVSQGLVVDGSTASEIVGWIMTIVGSFGGGKVAAQTPPAELPAA